MQCSRCYGEKCPADIKKCGVIRHGKTEAKECFIRHKDGHDIPVIKNARLAKDGGGHVLGIVETITDLTELKKIKQTAEEAQRKLKGVYRLGNIIGKSAVMQNVFDANVQIIVFLKNLLGSPNSKGRLHDSALNFRLKKVSNCFGILKKSGIQILHLRIINVEC